MQSDGSFANPELAQDLDKMIKAVGALIVTSAFIDTQLNQLLINLLGLPEHPAMPLLMGQYDVRIKIEIVKKYASLNRGNDTNDAVLRYIKRVEKVNTHRNFVAHHTARINDGKLVFYSEQFSKVIGEMKRGDTALAMSEAKGLNDVLSWVNLAREVLNEGSDIAAQASAL